MTDLYALIVGLVVQVEGGICGGRSLLPRAHAPHFQLVPKYVPLVHTLPNPLNMSVSLDQSLSLISFSLRTPSPPLLPLVAVWLVLGWVIGFPGMVPIARREILGGFAWLVEVLGDRPIVLLLLSQPP